jgi:hypothetical protein
MILLATNGHRVSTLVCDVLAIKRDAAWSNDSNNPLLFYQPLLTKRYFVELWRLEVGGGVRSVQRIPVGYSTLIIFSALFS